MLKSISQKANFKNLIDFLVLGLLGDAPNIFLGYKLRSWIYPLVFKGIGKSTYIQTSVELLGIRSIATGNKVSIFKGARINAGSAKSSVAIDDDASLQNGAIILAPGSSHIHIGKKAFIGPYTCISGPGNVTIGNNCSIAAHCGIFANTHKFDDPDRGPNSQGLAYEGITIEDDCWVGHNASILDGVTIGKGSVIGAGAVVNRSLPAGSVAVGIPAKVIRNRLKKAVQV